MMNHRLFPEGSPGIHHNDRGFLLGDGVFETIKYQNKRLLFFKEHYSRLCDSSSKLSIPLCSSVSDLEEECYRLLAMNELLSDEAAVRITLTRGISSRGIAIPTVSNPTLLMTAEPYGSVNRTCPTACVATCVRRNEDSMLSGIKVLNYLDSILARREAVDQGYSEAILLNTKGAVAETSIGNLFAVIEGCVVTPKLSDGALPGIIRQILLKAITVCGGIKEITLYPEDLFKATELFHTNSLIEIQSFSHLKGNCLITEKATYFTRQVMDQYQNYKEELIKKRCPSGRIA